MRSWAPLLGATVVSVAGCAALRLVRRPKLKRAQTLTLKHSLRCSDTEISLLSFNVLAGNFASSRKYGHCPPGFLRWEYRWVKIKSLLAKLDADVVALQEVEVARLDEFKEHMESLGYEMIAQDRTKTKFSVCNATFYRTSKLCSTWTDDRSRVLLTAFRRIASAQGDASDQPPSSEIYVANCHLEGHPYKAKERFNQIKKCLNRLQLQQSSEGTAPEHARVVIIGDFNSDCREGVYRLLYRGRLEGGYMERNSEEVLTPETFAHPFKLQDVYAGCASFRMPFTRAVPRFACTIDHAFSTENTPVVAVLQYMSDSSACKAMVSGLPNAAHPSDHLPLGCVFSLARPESALEE